MKALVTGCAGFIGSHLVEKLLEVGYHVVGIDSFTDYYPRWIKEKNMKKITKNKKFTFYEGDILKADLGNLVNTCEYVFHEAAQPGVRKSWGNEFEVYVNNNILVTQKLLEACKGKNIKKFIFASSSSVYGVVKKLPMRENEYPNPVSPYGALKLACESLCRLYWRNFDIPTTSLRYFTVYGEKQRPDMAFHRFIKAILNEKNITIYGDGLQTRDFTYVEDVVESTLLAAESDVEGEIFNIGGGSRITLSEGIAIIESILEKKTTIMHIGAQKGDMRHTYADISKARDILGYEPKVKLKDGLEREIVWLKGLES